MMRFVKTFVALSLALTLNLVPVSARDLTAADKQALEARIAQFEQSFASGDLQAVSSAVPPKLLASMADEFGMDPADLTEAMTQAMEAAMASVTLNSYEMSMDRATSGVTSAGRAYMLVPTTTVMTVEGRKMEATSETLAFADEDIWYLVRIDDARQVQFLTRAYPEFEGVDFPKGSIKVLEE